MQIRRARTEDYPDVARWMTELGLDNTPPDKARWCARYMDGTVVAEIEVGEAHSLLRAGYAFYAQNDADVYVRNVVTDPQLRRRGVGRALMSWIARETRACGASTWRLNVMPDNFAALGLYKSLGMRPMHASAAVRVDFEVCAKLRAKRSVVEVTDPAEWSALESDLKLPTGTLSVRAEQGDRLLVVRHKRGPVSLAVFDPSFPGAFIFKPVGRDDAEALLREMARQCGPGPGVLQVVVENDEDTVGQLVDRGGYVQLRFVHYAGPLPL